LLLQIVDAVHENGSFMYLQLWALGRAALPDVLEKGGHPLVAPSPIPILSKTKNDDDTLPRPLTVDEIEEYVRLYATAAEDAVLRAGFDGAEIHAANGYLPDQFFDEHQRQDGWVGRLGAESHAVRAGGHRCGRQGRRRTQGGHTVQSMVHGLRDIWGDRPYIANYDFDRDSTMETVEKEGGLISFGHTCVHCLIKIGTNSLSTDGLTSPFA
jgi:hypothetical protein